MSPRHTEPSQPFVTALRTPRGAPIRVGDGTSRVTVRVQFEALWDAVAVDAAPTSPIAEVVRAALHHFGLPGAPLSDYVVKLGGFEVKGDATVASSGATSGSTLLVAHRYRRPVR